MKGLATKLCSCEIKGSLKRKKKTKNTAGWKDHCRILKNISDCVKKSLTYNDYLNVVDSVWNCSGIQKIKKKKKRFDHSKKSY